MCQFCYGKFHMYQAFAMIPEGSRALAPHEEPMGSQWGEPGKEQHSVPEGRSDFFHVQFSAGKFAHRVIFT